MTTASSNTTSVYSELLHITFTPFSTYTLALSGPSCLTPYGAAHWGENKGAHSVNAFSQQTKPLWTQNTRTHIYTPISFLSEHAPSPPLTHTHRQYNMHLVTFSAWNQSIAFICLLSIRASPKELGCLRLYLVFFIFLIQALQQIMNTCMQKADSSLACWGGPVSYSSLWNSFTDFHTHRETATKLAEKKKTEDVFLWGLFSLYLSAFVFPLAFSPSVLVFPSNNEFLTSHYSPLCLPSTPSVCKDLPHFNILSLYVLWT